MHVVLFAAIPLGVVNVFRLLELLEDGGILEAYLVLHLTTICLWHQFFYRRLNESLLLVGRLLCEGYLVVCINVLFSDAVDLVLWIFHVYVWLLLRLII